MNCEILYVQAGFRNFRGTSDQIAHIHWVTKKAREFQKYTYFCFIEHEKTFDCGLQQTLENLQRVEYQTILPSFWEICIQVKKQQLELNMDQKTGSKSGKEYVKAVYCWESQFLGRLIRSPCVLKERGVWNSQGGRKGILFCHLNSLGLYSNNVSCLRIDLKKPFWLILLS